MSDAVVIGIVLVGLCATVYRVVDFYARKSRDDTRWRIEDIPVKLPEGDARQVVCVVGRGHDPVEIGAPVLVNSPDFNFEIELRRSEAWEKLTALGSKTRTY